METDAMTKLNRGFTLMELLAVMMIIGILSTVVTTAYVGMQRGAGMREAVNQLRSDIILARQKAITDGNKVCVFFEENTSEGVVEYFIVQAVGVSTKNTSSDLLRDYLNPELANFGPGTRIFLIDGTGNNVSAVATGAGTSAGEAYVKVNKPIFTVDGGDRYGVMLHTASALPMGFRFVQENNPSDMNMYFFPDGSVTGPNNGAVNSVAVYEEIDPARRTITISVSPYGMLNTEESF